MPHFRESSSSSSTTGIDINPYISSQRIVSDDEYAALSPDEPPLSEQLEPIAVVGMGKFYHIPDNSPSDFWKLMMEKRSGQTPKVPASRFNIDAHFHPNNDRPGSFGVLGGYFINETLQEFDPGFFGITPVEATWMDPQQRKLLEVVYEAFESAGLTLDQLSGSDTACFMATFTADFQQMSFKEPSFRHSLAATGVDPGLLSNRVSHVFNLRGPSIVVNTACSSSVYALHNACNALRTHECSAAVVGGSNLILTVDQHMNTAKLGVLSPTSTCHTFNSYANGYGRAEGVGAIYLKRLSDAVRDGDPIRGVIRSSATNNNGKAAGVGITYPGFDGQRNVMRHAYERSGLDPMLTGYFECHGTGTAIGDPLEVHAVSDVMNSKRTDEDGPLNIGAVKTSIGHSEAASGLSAIIKAILMVERGIIPPTHGVTDLNPKIDWKGWKVHVPTEPTPIPRHLSVMRVSVNSFGYGGTNAHTIVESPKSLLSMPQNYKYSMHGHSTKTKLARGAVNRSRPYLLVFSAHDAGALKRNALAHGKVAAKYSLLDLSFTLANHRTRFPSKGMLITTPSTLQSTFTDEMPDFIIGKKNETARTLGFVFTGQGAQWAGMGAQLMTLYPTFLKAIRRMDLILEDLEDAPSWTLEECLLENQATSRVGEAEFSQPLCTAVQVALAQLLKVWGIHPSVTIGHSSGEIAAAFTAGYISEAEAILAAYYRGQAVKCIDSAGAMMAVGLGAEAIAPYLEAYQSRVVVACHNSPEGVTLSGDVEVLKMLEADLKAEGTFARILHTNGKAYHSHHTLPAVDRYEGLLRKSKENGLPSLMFDKTKMVSSVSNSFLKENTILDEKYWSANLTSPVLFNQAVQTALARKDMTIDTLIEIGPHSALSGPIRQIKTHLGADKVQYLPTLIRGARCAEQTLKLAGELFLRDYPIDLQRITAIEELSPSGKITSRRGHLIVDLPPYQWDKAKKFWAESRESKEHRSPRFPRHDILGQLTIGGSLKEPTWRNILRLKDLPWLRDHSLGGEAVFPAAGYLSMAMEAITQLNEMSDAPLEIDSYIFRDISIQQALVTPDNDDGIETLFNMRPSRLSTDETRRWLDFNTSSVSTDGHVKNHMTGRICINTSKRRALAKPVPNLPQRASGKLWNQALKKVGFNYGPTFQDMDNITFDGMSYCAQATTNIKTSVMKDESRHVLHPAILDSCLQLMIVAIWAGRSSAMKFGAVPVTAEEIIVWKPTQAQLHGSSNAKAFSWIDPRGQRIFNAHNQLLAEDGQVLMTISGMQCTAYEAAIPQSLEDATRPQPYSQIVSKPDFSLLRGNQSHLSLAEFIELAQFKKPALKVLVLGPATATALLARNPKLCLTVATDATNITDVNAEMSIFTTVSVERLVPTVGLTVQSQEKLKHSFDIVVAPSTSLNELQTISELLSKDGRAPERRRILGIEAFLGESLSVTRIQKTRNPEAAPIRLLHHSDPPSCMKNLERELEKAGFKTERLRLGNSCPAGANVIALVDLEGPLMAKMAEDEFLYMQKILSDASKVLWISCSDTSKDVVRPEYAMTAGLLRSLLSERASLKTTLVDFSINDLASDIFGTRASQLASGFFTGEEELETEYISKHGQLLINRLVPFDRINEIYALTGDETQSQPFDPEDRLYGTIDSGKVVFSHGNADEVALQPNEVELRVIATGLTDEDKAVILGSSPGPDLGHEASGIVTRIGDAVTRVSPGDRMVTFSAGRLSSYQRVPECLVQRLHDSEDQETTAGLPMYYGPALYGLETLAKLEPKESVLILPGSGVLGGAAIRVTQALGGQVYVAVGSDTEAKEVQSFFGLSEDQILVEYSPELLQEYEIDVVFSGSSVEPGISQESWRNMPSLSRFVNCGKMPVGSSLDSASASRGASYLSVNLIGLFKRPQVLGRLLERIMVLYRDGSLPLPPLTTGSISDISSSLVFSSSLNSSKTIITLTKGSTIDVIRAPPRLQLHADATYLLVGCLGGLGRSLTTWMMKRGARNFAFLSRSGTDSEQAALCVQDLEARGARVQVIRGDVAIKADVEGAVASIPKDTPLRGIVNAAMVLRDGLFQNMSYESWVTSIQPKVLGSKNLHEATDHLPLDFFLMTSSVSGILGTPAQGNYAAANSYMDALARLRRSQGKPACAVILPMVLGVGVVAENLDLENSLTRKGMYGIDEEALLDAFEVSILEQQGQQHDSASFDHLVVGLDPGELHKAKKQADGDVDVFWAADQRFSILLDTMNQLDGANHGGGEVGSILSRVKAANSPAEAISMVRDHFVSKLARVLLLDVEEFSDESSGRSIASYGIDSMIGAELRNWIFKELGLDIAFQQLLSPSLTIHKFAEIICVSQGIVMDAE
ncbi:polyketide synthase [Fusarium sp. NRRL 52700]|uniref:Polyketide synthase n=1 Tax=Fusarium sp. TaxID=29916 RepID=A0A1Y0B9K3_FUSSX|nr:putative polyketide synthase [Fusarium sp. NRRL 52700]ART34989.1 polyketide synthase [Fusarium sp.]KAF5647464.1 polyketide synthase [Fusarium sp. NRRL 52700]